MVNQITVRIYPYVSIALLEITEHIEYINDFQSIVTLLFQIVIGLLTIFKLTKDLKVKLKSNHKIIKK